MKGGIGSNVPLKSNSLWVTLYSVGKVQQGKHCALHSFLYYCKTIVINMINIFIIKIKILDILQSLSSKLI